MILIISRNLCIHCAILTNIPAQVITTTAVALVAVNICTLLQLLEVMVFTCWADVACTVNFTNMIIVSLFIHTVLLQCM